MGEWVHLLQVHLCEFVKHAGVHLFFCLMLLTQLVAGNNELLTRWFVLWVELQDCAEVGHCTLIVLQSIISLDTHINMCTSQMHYTMSVSESRTHCPRPKPESRTCHTVLEHLKVEDMASRTPTLHCRFSQWHKNLHLASMSVVKIHQFVVITQCTSEAGKAGHCFYPCLSVWVCKSAQ